MSEIRPKSNVNSPDGAGGAAKSVEASLEAALSPRSMGREKLVLSAQRKESLENAFLAGLAPLKSKDGQNARALSIKPHVPEVFVQLSDSQSETSSRTAQYPQSSARFEAMKSDLRKEMARPHVHDPGLATTMRELYRSRAVIGSGSTAAAVRYERDTGNDVYGKFHTEKARNFLVHLEKWLANHPTASANDRAAAENVILDLKDSLKGA